MRPAGSTLLRRIFFGSIAASLAPLVLAGAFFLFTLAYSLTRTDTEELTTYASHYALLLRDREWRPARLPSPPPDQLGPETVLVDLRGLDVLAASYTGRGPEPQVPPAALPLIHSGEIATFSSVRPFSRSGTVVVVPVYNAGRVTGAVVTWMHIGEQTDANRTIFRIFGAAILFALILAGVLGWVLSRSVALPLRRLGQQASRIAAGDFSPRAAPAAPAELAELAAAFNHMAVELARLERVRRDLVANVSHELKSPLARVAGYVAAVQDGIGGEQARAGYLQIVQQETLRLSRLVDDLLDFSRLEAGRVPLHRLACDLVPVLERTVAAFRPQAEGVGVELTGPGNPRVPLADCDPERVVQMLTNLLTNALAVTPAGGRVAVSLEATGAAVEVSVTDTGPGVPPEEQGSIWERFYKVDKVRTPGAAAGHGLGLAIVKHLVDLHGGRVGVTSDGRSGSRFWFRLPAARPPRGAKPGQR